MRIPHRDLVVADARRYDLAVEGGSSLTKQHPAIATVVLLVIAASVHAADVPHVSGGIGSAEREELRTQEGAYNLKVVTAMKSGDYLAGVVIVIDSAAGERMLETTMAGPILLAKLPPGSYTIKATAGGQTLTQTVAVEAQGLKHVDFRWGDGARSELPGRFLVGASGQGRATPDIGSVATA